MHADVDTIFFLQVYDGVMKKITEASPAKKRIFFRAMKNARLRNECLERGKTPPFFVNLQHKMFDKIVFSKIRDRLGGRISYMAGGGAATSVPVLQFFEDIGVPICEGYGLTETSPTISSSTPDWENRRLGCVGVVIPGLEVRILDPATLEPVPPGVDGEICCSGPSVMVGYHNNQKATDEVFFVRDGKKWFRTGDLGHFVEEKFLKLTGRIKEQYKLTNGKYVVPAPLEDMLSRSQFIAQAFIYGDNKPFNIALLVPDMVELSAWALSHNLVFESPAALLLLPQVQELLTNEVVHASIPMKVYERPRGWVATTEPFTPDNFMLTPKLSLRRNNVWNTYGPIIEKLYSGTKGTIFQPLTAEEQQSLGTVA